MPVATTTPDLAALDAAFDELFGAIRRARHRAAQEGVGGLTLAQYQLLLPLLDTGSAPVGELATAAGVSQPTASRMLDALVKAGVAERAANDADRRVTTVVLTADGRRAVRARRKATLARRHALYEALSPEERRQAERLLPRVAEVIDAL